LHISSPVYQINREIRDREVRVVSETGEQLGVMPLKSALEIAVNRDLDLVKVQGNIVPPVCKLMDYGKFRFEQAKRDKEVKKNQKVSETKELWLSPSTGQHDFDTKLRTGRSFLQDGDRLKVTVKFKGREMAHQELGRNLLRKYSAACEDLAQVASESKMDGRRMSMLLAPKKTDATAKPVVSKEKSAEPGISDSTTSGATRATTVSGGAASGVSGGAN